MLMNRVEPFGIIHRIPDWRATLTEIVRVLKPGGRLFFEEVTAVALAHPTCQRLFDRPAEDRFAAGEFPAELARHHLEVGDR
jgi:ubiquinone/menaquinone biosynthesis C-methylase UbiE